MNPPPEQLIDDLRLLEPPEPFRLNPWMVAAVIALLVFLWWFRRWRRATRATRMQASAMRQAQEDALAELEKLFALIDREESRPYATESSAIIRRYIETRFELSAPRQSTEEFLTEAQQSPRLEAQHQASLGEFLRICDLLKFARTFADRAELKNLHEAAVRFVKETRTLPNAATPMRELLPQLDTFRFAAPWLLLALLLLPLWMWLRGRFAPTAAVQYSSSQLLASASRRTRSSPGRLLVAMRYLALVLLIVALARPQVDKGLSEREALGINIMFVLDFSGTMKTKDFSLENKRISRAEAMKRVVSEFIKARPSDRIGAVFFDRGAHLISPLTLDHDWLVAQLALEEPTEGTAPGSGMLIAAESLVPAKNQTKLIITVTDADQINRGPEPDEVARVIAPLGIKNHVIQMVDFSDSQRYTASGQILNEVARLTGGQFFKVSDYAGLRNVYRQIDQLEKSAFKERKQKAWRELIPWLALPALALLLLEFVLGRTVWRRLP